MKEYTYKNKHYKILHLAEHKEIESREWIEVVIYKQSENGKVYSREREEFFELFKGV